MASRRIAPAQRAPWTKQAVVAVVVLGLMGFTLGTLLTGFLPEGGLFAEGRARVRLHKDTARDLLAAIDIADDEADLAGTAALARLLLWLEHGAGDDVKAAVERTLPKANVAARTSPEGLYARALLLTSSPGSKDLRLVEDLAAAGEQAFVVLARATLAEHAGDDDGTALVLFERAALFKDPLPHATHRLARASAAHGDLLFARASLERLFHLAPEHAAGAVTAAVLGVVEAQHAAHAKGEDPIVVAGADEARVLELLDDASLDVLDRTQLSLVSAILAQSRAEVAGSTWSPPVLSSRSASVAEHGLELALLVGDVDTAEQFVKQQGNIESLSLFADVARARYLRAVPEDERRAASKSQRRVSTTSIGLPLGQLQFDFSRAGLPLSALPSPSFFPERRLQRLLVELAAGGTRERLEPRLVAVEKLGLVDRAIARGDLVAADALLKQARELAGADADLALTEAAIRARQNDPVGVKNAVAAAIAAAPLEPAVLITAARLSLDVDDVTGARRALQAFNRLGMKAASASAVTALLEAKSGDVGAARAALVEAKRLGGDTDIAALRAVILANRLVDVVEARAAADVLLERADRGDVGGGDVVATWIAEASWRKGDQPRAQAALKAIVDTRPQIAEAHLFYARTIAFLPARRPEAIVEVMKAIKGLGASDLGTEAQKLLITLKSARK